MESETLEPQCVTLDVMPLVAGYLPLPSVRLSKYIAANTKGNTSCFFFYFVFSFMAISVTADYFSERFLHLLPTPGILEEIRPHSYYSTIYLSYLVLLPPSYKHPILLKLPDELYKILNSGPCIVPSWASYLL